MQAASKALEKKSACVWLPGQGTLTDCRTMETWLKHSSALPGNAFVCRISLSTYSYSFNSLVVIHSLRQAHLTPSLTCHGNKIVMVGLLNILSVLRYAQICPYSTTSTYSFSFSTLKNSFHLSLCMHSLKIHKTLYNFIKLHHPDYCKWKSVYLYI